MKQTIILSAVALGLCFTSCKKNKGYDSSGSQPTVSYKMTASNTSYTMAKTTASASIVWTTAYVNPAVVKFEARKDNTHIEFTSTNNQQIDLLAPTPIDFGGFTIPPGTYKEIELDIKLDKNGPNPAMELDGQFTLNAVSLPVSIQVNAPVQIKTEEHDVDITADNNFEAVTTLVLPDITTGITTDMLLNADLTNGTVIISASSNRNIYNTILSNLGNKRHKCEFDHHHK